MPYKGMAESGFFFTMPDDEQYPWYEKDENGEDVLVKSERSDKKAFIRFVNRTSTYVDVIWRNYYGRRVFYVTLQPYSYYNTDTYISHPWEFTETYTKERFLINNKDIFRAPECIANMQHRTTWYISVPMRPLLKTAMLKVASTLKKEEQVDSLGLPKPLADDLKSLVKVWNAVLLPRLSPINHPVRRMDDNFVVQQN